MIAAIAALSTLLAGAVAPAAAATTPGAEPLVSCDNPPDTPGATSENRDRFVDLWTGRFADKAWLDHFTELETVPDTILAEGFHDMGAQTQVWLNSCLLDAMLVRTGETPTAQKRDWYLMGINVVIFGKGTIAQMREELNKTTPPEPEEVEPLDEELTSDALTGMANDLLNEPSLTSADQPRIDVDTPRHSTSKNFKQQTSPHLQELLNAPAVEPKITKPHAPTASGAQPANAETNTVTELPLATELLAPVDELMQTVSEIQGELFTLPAVNLLAPAFYKVCAESPAMPLRCSISLPVGTLVPTDVTGDNFPDVLVMLAPMTNLTDIGARFDVKRMFVGESPEPLKAHVFAVYDTPFVKKRVEFGYDGRASTLANDTSAVFAVKNVLNTATTGDVEVDADVTSVSPGTTESLTFAVKDLVGGSTGVPPAEENSLAGAVQLSPFPDSFDVGAHLTHTAARSQDVFTVDSSSPTRVDAVIDQETTTTTPESQRRFTTAIDELPDSVRVDLVRDGDKQSIDYTGSAPIDLVQASDTTTPDVSQAGSFTESIYEVKGVPGHVQVDLQRAEDIQYTASAKIPEVSFSTRTLADNVLQNQITAKAHEIPKSVHVTNLTSADQTAVTYDADDVLQDIELSMYDLNQDETNLVAKATDIPTHMELTQTKSTGVADFSANDGIGLIEATLTRGGGAFLPHAGDHATVLKSGDGLGVDVRLSGFKSLHFDGSEDTTVELGLIPGGQSFDAIADLDDPNVLAKAHVSELPSDMAVTISPVAGSATYSASSVIPLLTSSFVKRDTDTFAQVKLTDLPKNIGLTFNTSGDTPQIAYDADSRLGSIEATYQEAPGALAIHGVISDLPPYMAISGKDPISFDARTSAAAAPGSSHLGQVLFQYATDGTFASPPTPDDHVYLDTVGGTHAEVQYTGLRYASVDTTDEELHAELRNQSPRRVRSYLTTPNLTMTGFVDSVPGSVKIDQVGNTIKYTASSTIDEIYTNVQRTVGDSLAVTITDIPSSVQLVFDGAGSQLDWTASSATGSISAAAHLTGATLGTSRSFDAALTITDIPQSWAASWADGNVLFEAPAPGIGTISAHVSNHGAYHVTANDHLTAFFDQPSGDLDASLKISNLRKASFTKLTSSAGGGFEADLRMGTGGAFDLFGSVNRGATAVTALGTISNMPTTMNLKSDGGRIQYSGSLNPDLTLSVEAGTPAAIANTPTPPSVHGVAVRDGAGGGGKAVKAKLFLTGLPTSLDLNSPAGTYSVSGYHPSIATLVVDARLDHLVPEPLTLQVQQVVPTASPTDFAFGPFLTSTAGDGTHHLSLKYTSNQDLGELTAEATYDNTDDAKLNISEIPKSINVTGAFSADQKKVSVAMDHGIAEIEAGYKKVGAIDFAANVRLSDVPRTVALTLGRDTASGGGKQITAPDFTFETSDGGLDIDAAASAAIATPADIKAAANLQVTNLGGSGGGASEVPATVTGALNGTSLKVTSAPATQQFLLEAAGVIKFDVDLGFNEGPFVNTGNLNVDIDAKRLTIGFENASDLQLDLGITTGLKGDYSSFTFGEDTKTEITVEDLLRFVVGTPFGNVDFVLLEVNPTSINFENVISHFRMASNRLAKVLDLPILVVPLVGHVDAEFFVRPSPEFSTSGPSFTVGQPPSGGGHPPAWLITPNLNLLGFGLPDFAIDVIAYFATPYGSELGFKLECHPLHFTSYDCTP